jgi:hypothetical protein
LYHLSNLPEEIQNKMLKLRVSTTLTGRLLYFEETWELKMKQGIIDSESTLSFAANDTSFQ